MTILPKKKSSQQSKADRDGADRGVDSVQYSPRGLSQNQVRFFSWPNPLCLIHHGRHLFIPGILKPFTFEVTIDLFM